MALPESLYMISSVSNHSHALSHTDKTPTHTSTHISAEMLSLLLFGDNWHYELSSETLAERLDITSWHTIAHSCRHMRIKFQQRRQSRLDLNTQYSVRLSGFTTGKCTKTLHHHATCEACVSPFGSTCVWIVLTSSSFRQVLVWLLVHTNSRVLKL